MDQITTAITHLVDEYDLLDGLATTSACIRRSAAMDAVTASVFMDLDVALDPYGLDDVADDTAGECLQIGLIISDVLAATMLDFREKARQHGIDPRFVRDRLLRMLQEIWAESRAELLAGVE